MGISGGGARRREIAVTRRPQKEIVGTRTLEAKGGSGWALGGGFPKGGAARRYSKASGCKKSVFHRSGWKRSAFTTFGRKRAVSNESRHCLSRLEALDGALTPLDEMSPGGRTQNWSLHYKCLERLTHRMSREKQNAKYFFC